ncbi:MAG: hypothetical protein NVV67_01120 [Pseudoxanthomonas sp.]|nr:hypothetical protein [Pseudoxanthomonas sp.]
MVRYRRNRIAGATYFFTVTLRDRRSDLLVREIEALRAAWRVAARRIPHVVIAAVVLPDHLHAVIRMTDATANYPRLWQDIKKGVHAAGCSRRGAVTLAVALLGANRSRRGRAAGAGRLRAHQSSQEWAGRDGSGLAAFQFPSLRVAGMAVA